LAEKSVKWSLCHLILEVAIEEEITCFFDGEDGVKVVYPYM